MKEKQSLIDRYMPESLEKFLMRDTKKEREFFDSFVKVNKNDEQTKPKIITSNKKNNMNDIEKEIIRLSKIEITVKKKMTLKQIADKVGKSHVWVYKVINKYK